MFSKGMTHNLLFYLLIRSSLFASHKFSSHNITSNSTLLIPHSTLKNPLALEKQEVFLMLFYLRTLTRTTPSMLFRLSSAAAEGWWSRSSMV